MSAAPISVVRAASVLPRRVASTALDSGPRACGKEHFVTGCGVRVLSIPSP
jgi:hypothetical protein